MESRLAIVRHDIGTLLLRVKAVKRQFDRLEKDFQALKEDMQ